jgi:uroporphyrinogen decarboxylase
MNNLIIKSKGFPRPLWFMRQAGRYLPEYRQLRKQSTGFMDLCLTPEKAKEITLQPLRRFPDIDAAILFSDILIIPYALGYNLEFMEKVGPVLSKVDLDSIPFLQEDGFLQKISPIMETIKKVKPALDQQTLIGFSGAPWTVAAYMLQGEGGKEMAKAKGLAYANLKAMDKLIDVLVEATSIYLLEQVKAGAEMLQIFESWGGILPEPYFERWCVFPTLRIIEKVKAPYPDIPIFIFPRGASSYYKKYFQDSWKPDGINIDTNVDIEQILNSVPENTIIQGGMDPQLLKAGGEPMIKEAQRILSLTSHRKYIFNLGHGMTPDIPIDHVEELISCVKEWKP